LEQNTDGGQAVKQLHLNQPPIPTDLAACIPVLDAVLRKKYASRPLWISSD